MKTRLLWTLILGVGLTALYFGITQPHVSTIPDEIRDSLDDLKPPALPPLEMPALVMPEPPALVMPETPALRLPGLVGAGRSESVPTQPEVPIQNQATIDFSTGAPVVRTHGEDQDALESALQEISDVLKDAKIEANK
jgi:hypothetical protein